MSQPEAALLFAAGLGTRMRPLTDDRPKPLVKVAGRTLIDHALELLTPLGLPRVVANAHYRGDMLAAHLNGSGVAISHEAPQVLETGGGLKQALPLLGAGPVQLLRLLRLLRPTTPKQPLPVPRPSIPLSSALWCRRESATPPTKSHLPLR